MTHLISKSLLTLLFTLTLPLSTFQVFADDIPDIPVNLDAQSVEITDETYLSLNYENYPQWHTYWKNPGDAGLPIQTSFFVNEQEVELTELEWPAPRRYFEDGDILAYGYSGEYSLFFKPTSDQISEWEDKDQDFTIKSSWLVCRHVCIPGRKEVTGQWVNGKFHSNEQRVQKSQEDLTKRFKELPQLKEFPDNLDIILAQSPDREDRLTLYYTFTQDEQILNNRNLITPFPERLLGFQREHLYQDQSGYYYGKIEATWDGDFAQPPVPFPLDGIFEEPITIQFLLADPQTQKTYIIEKTFERFSKDHAQRAEELIATLSFVDNQTAPNPMEASQDSKQTDKEKTKVVSDTSSTSTSLIYYLLFAFIGGFILNFMPCVLPVISLKLFDLIKNRQETHRVILKHNLAYTLGVLSTFMALALAIVAIKSTGEVVGWGFQLQSPRFVGALIFIIFIMTLNLFGLFEFGTPGGKQLGNVELKRGFSGDFGSGALATILATPCSAPFLGTALSFAFAASTLTILLVFIFIGLGLALPFIVTGFFPNLINFLPKPGMWMDKLKKFLGLTLLVTSLWLADLFLALTDGTTEHMMMLFSLILIFFFFYSRKHISKHPLYLMILLVLAVVFAGQALYKSGEQTKAQTNHDFQMHGEIEKAGMMWERFSEQKLEELQEKGEIVFINFTAQWCVTCNVNERVVLNTRGFREMIQENNVRLLLADWTRREEHIGQWLEEHGMVGIPAYFVLQSDGTLVSLGETVSTERVRRNLH